MQLPETVRAYFEADGNNDCEALLACFAQGAIVRDEGRSHRGHHAIASWWEHAKAKYRHVAEPLEASAQEDVVRVLARVSGAFPGSPATLAFAFRLSDGKIAALEIGA